MAATTISRSNIGTNDDGSGTTGTVINTAYVGLIYDNIDALFSSTTGINLNQAGGDGSILTMESSDVAHGMTAQADTACYGRFMKQSATAGGLNICGLSEGTGGLELYGFATTADTTKSTAAVAPLNLFAAIKSGTSVTTVGANGNLAVISNSGATRFIFDAEGDSHQDVGTAWTNFDAHDDVALLNALTGVVSRPGDPLRSAFSQLVGEHRTALVENRIVTINDGPGEDGSIFVNWSRFHMLMIGAVRQLGRELADTRGRLLAIEGRA
jgi:hypothetical protein